MENGVSISVSEPTEYTPSDSAMGQIDGYDNVVFEFVLTNNSEERYEPALRNTASSAGEEASTIFDTEKGVEFPPSTVVLPGKSVKWQEAFSLADPSDITLQVSFGFTYDSPVFTNK